MNLINFEINKPKKLVNFNYSAFYFLLFLNLTTFSLIAQNKNSDIIDKRCLIQLNDISTYQSLVNDNDVVFIFVESIPSNNQTFLDFSTQEKTNFIERLNLNQNEFFNSPKNVILYRRSIYLNFSTQKQSDFKTWFNMFDFWIGQQLEKNTQLPKIILLPSVDFEKLKSYFSTL